MEPDHPEGAIMGNSMPAPFAAIRQGFGDARRSRGVVWILFLVNLALAALAALPIYEGVLRFTGLSLTSQALARGLPVEWLTDFAINSPGSLKRYAAWISFTAMLSMPVNVVLAGGVLSQFRAPQTPFSLGDFLRQAGHFAPRLLRLWLIALVGYWIVFRVINQGVGGLFEEWSREQPDGRTVFWVHLALVAAVALGLIAVNIVVEYARVWLVMEDGASVASALGTSLRFLARGTSRAVTVYALPSLSGLLLAAVYLLAAPPSDFREPWMLIPLFVIQQVVLIARYWFRVATWASEWSYYSGAKEE